MEFINLCGKIIVRPGLFSLSTEVLPAEPITKPAPTITPRPNKDDPWNVPQPLIDSPPKAICLI